MEYILIGVFFIASIAGFLIIRRVPSLLHTPLMSGTNALSGISVLGALTVTAFAVKVGSTILGAIAVVLATVNVVGGFIVTHRMLKMFRKKDKPMEDNHD